MQRNEKIAELVGNIFGDGSLVKMGIGKTRFQLRGHMTEDREHYERFVIRTFNKYIFGPLTGKRIGTLTYSNRNCYGIATESKVVTKLLIDCGIHLGKKLELSIPKWIKKNKNFKPNISF